MLTIIDFLDKTMDNVQKVDNCVTLVYRKGAEKAGHRLSGFLYVHHS
jgi:hypothetical protein